MLPVLEFRQKREAIEAQVRVEHAEALASATDYWQRFAVEDTIDREIAQKLKALTPSPYSLWSSR